ncbi:MAG: hypothetical protein ACFFG0_12445, partial [Candidatus Thorarchaeota archaeon]
MTEKNGRLEFIEFYWKDEDSETSELAVSINRYLKYVLRLGEIKTNKNSLIKILLVEIDDSWNSDGFYKKIEKNEFGDISGILFFTLEEFPRGDHPISGFNNSRMLREFLENSFNAVTSNHKDLFRKLYTLIYRILKGVDRYRHKKSTKNRGEEKIPFPIVLNELIRLRDFVEFQINQKKSYRKVRSFIELSNYYPYGGIHTKDGHNYFRKFIESLKDNSKNRIEESKNRIEESKNRIEESAYEIKEMGENYDLASIVANNPFQYRLFKILIIDDNPEKVYLDIEDSLKFLPINTEVYITINQDWRNFLNDKMFWESLYKRKASLKFIKVSVKENKKLKKEVTQRKISLFERNKKNFKFQYIIVDLLLGNYNEGNKIINNLEKFRFNFNRLYPEQRTHFDIITLSLSEEAHDISRSLNEGSLHFVPKKRIYMLPAVIAQLEKSRQVIKKREMFMPIKKSHNFEKLYRLPEIVKRRLQNEAFLDLPYLSDIQINEADPEKRKEILNNLEIFMKVPAEDWIKEMPKADIHCHFGGSMRGDLAFLLSLNMLTEPYEYKVETLTDAIRNYIEFMRLILNQKFSLIKDLFKRFKIILKVILKFGLDKFDSDLNRFGLDLAKFNSITTKLQYRIINFLNEEIEKTGDKETENRIKEIRDKINDDREWIFRLLRQAKGFFDNSELKKKDFDSIVVEKVFFEILKHINKKENLNIHSFQAVNIFNVLIGILEGRATADIDEFWENIENISNIEWKTEKEVEVRDENPIKKIIMDIGLEKFETIKKDNRKLLQTLKSFQEKKEQTKGRHNILNHFISAKKRQTRYLGEYLGGNEFTGAEQLKKKENIIAALYDIIKRNVDDNVRLLELKFSPDGYMNDNLTLQEAVQTALLGTDLITLQFYKQGKFIRVNYILTVKRHKTPKEAALEVSATIVNREREKFYKEIKPNIERENVEILKYDWKPSKVVGVDLAGLEKGNPARNFVNDFYPLFKTSSFISIHAGEEDTAQSIWEAIYLLHANRIGHGLTLRENPELKELFKNLQICI